MSYWDYFESKVVTVADKIVPVTEFRNNRAKNKPPPAIKNKINKRNRLLKSRKQNPSDQLKARINLLSSEIKTFYFTKKRDSVRKGILPGDSRSLWSALFSASSLIRFRETGAFSCYRNPV